MNTYYYDRHYERFFEDLAVCESHDYWLMKNEDRYLIRIIGKTKDKKNRPCMLKAQFTLLDDGNDENELVALFLAEPIIEKLKKACPREIMDG